MDIEKQLINNLIKDIVDEIDKEIINEIRKDVGNSFEWFFYDIEWNETS